MSILRKAAGIAWTKWSHPAGVRSRPLRLRDSPLDEIVNLFCPIGEHSRAYALSFEVIEAKRWVHERHEVRSLSVMSCSGRQSVEVTHVLPGASLRMTLMPVVARWEGLALLDILLCPLLRASHPTILRHGVSRLVLIRHGSPS
jgi:hypothetical protein